MQVFMGRVLIAVVGLLPAAFLASCGSPSSKPSIPSSSTLAKAASIDTGNIELTPPQAGTKAAVTAAEAWRAIEKWPRAGSYRLVLADWRPSTSSLMFGATHFSGGLVWVVEGSHVKIPCSWNTGPPGPVNQPCRVKYESAIWFVNASTGQASKGVWIYPSGS